MVDESAKGVSVGKDEVADRTEKSVTEQTLAEVRNNYRTFYIDFLEYVHRIENPDKFSTIDIEVGREMINVLAVRATTVHIVTAILKREEELKYGTDTLGSGG